MPIIVCVEWNYSDTALVIVQHDDTAEALAVLDMLREHDGPEPVAVAETLLGERDVQALADVVGGYLLDSWGESVKVRPALLDGLPIAVLRAAVEGRASYHDTTAAERRMTMRDERAAKVSEANARALREALFLREQRDRIAADLADMERIGAMVAEEQR